MKFVISAGCVIPRDRFASSTRFEKLPLRSGTRMYSVYTSVSSVYAKVDRTLGRRSAELVHEIVVGHLPANCQSWKLSWDNFLEDASIVIFDRRPFACDIIFLADCEDWVDDRAIFETLFSTGLLLKLAQNDVETWRHIIGLRLLGAKRRCHARILTYNIGARGWDRWRETREREGDVDKRETR